MEHEKTSQSYILAISIVASALILSGVIWVAANGVTSSIYDLKSSLKGLPSGGSAYQGGQPSATQQPSGPVQIDLGNAPLKGSANAKVTIVEFSDFQCPFCRSFYVGTYGQLVKDYVDSGKVKIYFKYFPLSSIHPAAEKSAEAAACANDQGKFWEMHDKIFNEQQKLNPDGNTATYGPEQLKQWAKDIGLDTAKFNQCLDSNAKAQIVQDDFNQGVSVGVSGTPTFYVDGQQLVGAQPFASFKQLIDSELAKS